MRNQLLVLPSSPQSGFSVLEVLIATALIGFLGLCIAATSGGFATSSRRDNLIQSRNQLVIQIRDAAGNLQGLQRSLSESDTGNAALKRCVCGGTCSSEAAGSSGLPLKLLDANGTIQSPAYFDVNGFACSNPNATNCYIQVTTSFVAQCWPSPNTPGGPPLPNSNPVPAPTCSVAPTGVPGSGPAEFFAVSYLVEQTPSSAAREKLLKRTTGIVFVQVEDLLASRPPPSGGPPCP